MKRKLGFMGLVVILVFGIGNIVFADGWVPRNENCPYNGDCVIIDENQPQLNDQQMNRGNKVPCYVNSEHDQFHHNHHFRHGQHQKHHYRMQQQAPPIKQN